MKDRKMKMTNATTRSPKRSMTSYEIQRCIVDVLELPLGRAETAATLLLRVNGASLNDVLAAALAVARDQSMQRICKLEDDLAEMEEERDALESELQNLRQGLEKLLEEGK